LLVLARNETAYNSLQFSSGRDQQLTLAGQTHFHRAHPERIATLKDDEQVLPENFIRI
jgi:hypothetical protein